MPASGTKHHSRARVNLLVLALAWALLGALAPTGPALAQEPNQVTGLSVVQDDGFATLRWTPVAGATDYQIERTPVDVANVPTGAAVIVGVWRPNRTVTPDMPAFADAGFNPGDRFQWRVRARFGTTAQPYSAPAFGTTLPPWGDPGTPGENLRTQWETTQAVQYTSDTEEYSYTAALDAASDRVRVVEIGRTVMNRPINMFVIGYPAPPATASEISASPAALVNCNVHGNEPSSRESCLILARELAFGDDPRTIDILSNVTILLVPSINGDGRAANTRGNSTGQDLNRDYSLIRQPETFAFVQMLRDYTPEASFDGHEFGNTSAGDLPVLPPRHLNVAQPIFDQSMDMIENWMYVHGSEDGWWYCPYGCQGGGSVGLSEETILRNYVGLRNSIGSLLEARSSGGTTRPDEGNTQNNRRRKTYSAIYTYQRFFDYYRANRPAIASAIGEATAFQISNTGPIVFRGSRPIPAHPAPHPGEAPPPEQPPTGTIDPPPCGYRMPSVLYSMPLPDGPTIEARLAAHGVSVTDQGTDRFVAMRQPLRGLIPLLLDGSAAEPIVAAGIERVPCGPARIDVDPDSLAVSMPQDDQRDEALSIRNTATPDASDTLIWDITEAPADCSAPADLPWVGAAPTAGTTSPGNASGVTVTFDSTGITGPDQRDGLLCVASNDPDASVVSVPVSMTVQAAPSEGARARKIAVREGLAALVPTGDAKDDQRIAHAVRDLDQSLAPKRWVDGDRLDPKHGKQVFDEERHAVKELEKVDSADVAWAIEELVEIDEQLAQTAIDDASSAILANITGDPKELDRANRELLAAMEEMDKAQAERDAGDPEKAIEHYRKAWEHAQKAIEHAEKA